MPEKILTVEDLEIKFELRGKTLHAIRGISMELHRGEILAIVGESGSGKSVFTKSFMGLLDQNGHVTAGKVTYYGADNREPVTATQKDKESSFTCILSVKEIFRSAGTGLHIRRDSSISPFL